MNQRAFAVDRPNIVWIFSDDHAPNAIGAYGGRFEEYNLTPNIDSIATEGIIFDRAYVGNSICAPSRATLLTGKHSHLNGKFDNRGPFDHDQQQFQKILQKNGYQTAMIGKIHLSGAMQGFDYWEVLPGQGKYVNPDFITAEGKTKYEGHSTDIVTDRALNWLDTSADKEKPFMMMVHYKAPHRNWEPAPRIKEVFRTKTFPEPDTLFDDYNNRATPAATQDMSISKTMRMQGDLKVHPGSEREKYIAEHKPEGKDLIRWKYQAYMQDYLGCIAGVDENIGRILKYLKDNNLDKNTVVMYSADQGFYLGEHGWFDKRFMYEESFRTPLVAKWPGVISPGQRNSDLVQNIDFAETFLDIAGAPAPDDMQGESIVPLLKGETPEDWRKSLYYHYYEYPAVHSVRRHEGVFDGRHKLIRYYGKDVKNGEEWELFDLKNDPEEMRNAYLNPEMAGKLAEMKQELGRLKEYYQVPEGDGGLPLDAYDKATKQKRPANAKKLEFAFKPGQTIKPNKIPYIAGRGIKLEVPLEYETGTDGVLIAQGGASFGYSLWIKEGIPQWTVSAQDTVVTVAAKNPLTDGKANLTATLSTTGELSLKVNGGEPSVAKIDGPLSNQPRDPLSLGSDSGSPVTEYPKNSKFTGKFGPIKIELKAP